MKKKVKRIKYNEIELEGDKLIMDFKIDNVYSAVNADTLKPGTKAIFAENMEQLKYLVEKETGIDTLDCVLDEGHALRFMSTETKRPYALAYAVYDGLKWTDLKVGDVITNGKYVSMITNIDYSDEDNLQVYAGAYWITNDNLKDYRKV